MKKTGKSVFIVALVLILSFSALALFGVSTQYGDRVDTIIRGAGDIRWGIDIRGGVDVTFTPPYGYDADRDQMIQAQSILSTRMMAQGITDYEMHTDYARQRIIVRFPWRADEADFNPEQAVAELGEMAMLTFREGTDVDWFGMPTGEIILEGMHVERARPALVPAVPGGPPVQPVVALTLTDEGAERFAEATGRLINQQISIWLDGERISAPVVRQRITGGQATIDGLTSEEANSLAARIDGGALPFRLHTEHYNMISPTLGMGALDTMVRAGLIAFILMCLFMLIYYRLSGLVACIALIGQTSLIIAFITGFLPTFPSFTLTLPGIAGIILSIGMGIDANIITSERIGEELRLGKTLEGAIESGYKRAFSAILDGNVTTVIIAAILMGAFGPPGSFFSTLLTPFFFMFGPSAAGAIYSFGYTLLMGVLFNMLMGVFMSRIMLKSLCKFKVFRNPKLYGGRKTAFNINFNRNAVKYFSFSIALMLLIAVAGPVMGVELDIEFRGGTIITYAYDGELGTHEVAAAASSLTGTEVTVLHSTDLASGTETLVLSMARAESLTGDEIAAFTENMRAEFPYNNLHSLQIYNVDPSMGRDFMLKTLTAVALALAIMLFYVAIRFRKIGGLSAGAMSVVALMHNCAIVFGVFVIFGFPLSANFMAVLLTIVAYSLNDTIVLYDRIRENKKVLSSKTSVDELVSRSINQTLIRSVNTSLTTAMAMLIVTVMAMIFNVQSIVTFALPLTIGLLAGMYSSLCIAGPLWVKWQNRKKSA